MKKILYFLGAAVLSLGLASCSKGVADISTPEVEGQITFVARIADEEVDTKASLSGNDIEGYQVLWSEGDQIRIRVKGATQEIFTYTLTHGAGTKYGAFTGPALPDGEFMASYGDNFSAVNGGVLYDKQSYSPSKNACCAPMMATVTVTDGVANISDFKNICGLMRLELTGNGTAKSIKVTTTQDQTGLIGLDEEGAAFIRIYPGGKYITLDCGENGVELSSTAKTFYISMPKNSYTGLKFEVTGMDGNTQTKTLKADKVLNIARAQITPVSLSVMLVPTTGTMPDKTGNPITWVQLWENGPKWATCDTDPVGSFYAEFEDQATDLWGDNWRTPDFDIDGLGLHGNCDTSWDEESGRLIVTGRGLYSNNSISFAPGEYWLGLTITIGMQYIIRITESLEVYGPTDDEIARPIRPVVKE